jgi:hypothetical protein
VAVILLKVLLAAVGDPEHEIQMVFVVANFTGRQLF